MPAYKKKYLSREDGCVYCWDEIHKKWVKIRPAETIPEDVKQLVLIDKQLTSEIEV